MKMEVLDRLYLYKYYRQRYTVIPITTVRGPLDCCLALLHDATVCLQFVLVVFPYHTHLLFCSGVFLKLCSILALLSVFFSVVRNHEESYMRNIFLYCNSILLVFQEEISFIVFLCLNLAIYLCQARF